MAQTFEVTFDSILPEGKALARYNDLTINSIGAIPGDTCLVEITKKKRKNAEVKVLEVIKPSEHRIQPKEDHYFTCSPWQAVEYSYQIELKKTILAKCFADIAHDKLPVDDFWYGEELYGYRTKVEFSFAQVEGKITLAYFQRGSYDTMLPLHEGCLLLSPEVNSLALDIVTYLNDHSIPFEILKGVTVRESKTTKTCIAILVVSTMDIPDEIFNTLKNLPADNFMISFSGSASSQRSFDQVLFTKGQDYLEEKVNGLTLRYPVDGFFQNNLAGFEAALNTMLKFTYKCDKIVELYSGVGTIGLNMCGYTDNVYGVEIIESATKYAEINKKLNGIMNYIPFDYPAEDSQELILAAADILVLDPPRSGLNPKVIKKIKKMKPKRIIYLSCNPVTQARDYAMMNDLYKPVHLSGYDFYPNTTHMESLLVLDLR